MTDVLPWIALLAILGYAGASTHRTWVFSRSEMAAGLALLTLSVAINAAGAFSMSSHAWSLRVGVDSHPERVFDWRYPQFAAALLPIPNYAIGGGAATSESK